MHISYYQAFAWLCVVCGVCKWVERGETRTVESSPTFKAFQKSFMFVYMLALASDWLQGPYVYALYAHYNFEKAEIAYLFIAGFASSMVFGTIVGSFADKFGRRRNCILYGFIYVAGCVTKHYNNFWVLIFGRVLAGIATSLLFSAFESWMVREHNKLGFKEEWLSQTFSLLTFGNGMVAIISSLAANFVVESLDLGFVVPFDMAVGTLVACTLCVLRWEENYGDEKTDFSLGFKNAWRSIFSDEKIMLLGLIQSLFEGTMYTFVFMWTPALESTGATSIPHGMVFACFMVAVMTGSALSSVLLSGKHALPPENYMRWLYLASAAAMAVPAFDPSEIPMFGSFLAFELCVGVFWPSIGRLRSLYLPEECRGRRFENHTCRPNHCAASNHCGRRWWWWWNPLGKRPFPPMTPPPQTARAS
mmetsp:Transcript_44284/g.140914  ORF Transcript_44284/g.140914 Transcript_44284/m.140914 type:complete len:419 (-) Transcript_44284:149-1405(-)